MIKRIIVKTILMLFIFGLPAFSATPREAEETIDYLQNVCSKFQTKCTVSISNDLKIKNAYTLEDGSIIFTQVLVRNLTPNEMKAVGLHEVGHVVLEHYRRYYAAKKGVATKNEAGVIRRQHELEADMFATVVQLSEGRANYLPSAFYKIIPLKYRDLTQWSHPAVNYRIRFMKSVEREYIQLQNNGIIRQ